MVPIGNFKAVFAFAGYFQSMHRGLMFGIVTLKIDDVFQGEFFSGVVSHGKGVGGLHEHAVLGPVNVVLLGPLLKLGNVGPQNRDTDNRFGAGDLSFRSDNGQFPV